MAQVLVTGVNGFIGSHVAGLLLALGHPVRGVVRGTSDLRLLAGLKVDLSTGDVTDRASLRAPMKGVEVVVHAAARVSDWGPWREFRRVNVEGTLNTAAEAADAGVRRFVNLGSAAIQGFPGFRNLAESALPSPTPFPYCRSKLEAESRLFELAARTPMEAVSLRPGNVFGPRDHIFIGKYLDALERGRLAYVARGNRLTAPCYVENLAQAVAAASFAPGAGGEAFFVTDGLWITWREFTEAFAVELGVAPPRWSVPFPAAYAAGALLEAGWRLIGSPTPPTLTRYRACNAGRDFHFSIEKARLRLGYRPGTAFPQAVKRTVRWYLGRREEGGENQSEERPGPGKGRPCPVK